MNVGIYVDAYNLYYGGRSVCGRGQPGWRWLDIRALATRLLSQIPSWPGAVVSKVVYCTARVDGRTNPPAQRDQDVYLKALLASGSVDHIEYGNYVARAKKALLASVDGKGRPTPITATWPIKVRTQGGTDVPDAQFMAQVLNIEEKGSDVNVATHLLMDTLRASVDAALVISNDSDLKLPIHEARQVVPVSLVHPGIGQLAGALKAKPTDGVGNHVWQRLKAADFSSCQLASSVGNYVRPNGW